jgi:hypothetical protein
MKFQTITDLIEFTESIPEEQWCVGTRNDGEGRHCFLGHLDKAIGLDSDAEFDDPSVELVAKLIPDAYTHNPLYPDFDFPELKVVIANNDNPDNPKQGVLNYLKSVL